MTKDTRETLGSKESFAAMLEELFRTGGKASILYDQGGLDRAGGVVTGFVVVGGRHFIRLDGGAEIPVSTIVAVNGIFADDYSEC